MYKSLRFEIRNYLPIMRLQLFMYFTKSSYYPGYFYSIYI